MSSKDMTELLPCPFCGSRPVIEQDIENRCNRIYCDEQMDCPITPSAAFDTMGECIAAWNRRAPDPLRQDVVEAAEKWAETQSVTEAVRPEAHNLWVAVGNLRRSSEGEPRG